MTEKRKDRKTEKQKNKMPRNRKGTGLYLSMFLIFLSSVFCSLSFVICPEGIQAQELNKKEEDAFYVAAKAYEDGFYDVSLVLFDRYLKTFVQSEKRIQALIYIGQNYFRQEKYLKALDQFETLRKMPEAAGVLDRIDFWLGEIYAKGRDYRQAAEYYQGLIDRFPDSFYFRQAYTALALARLNDAKFKEALETYRAMAGYFKDAQSVEEAAFGICEALYRMRDFPALSQALEEFLTAFPASASRGLAYFYLGEAAYYLERYDDAIRAYQRCLETSAQADQLAAAEIGIGWSFLRLRRFDDAGRVFSRFTDDESAPAGILLGKAVVASGLARYGEAVAFFDRVISVDKNEEYAPLAYYGKGEALYHLGEYGEAIICYRISLDKLRLLSRWLGEPRELRDKILYGLGWAYLKVGDFQSAQQEFQKVATFSSDKIIKLSALCQLGDVYQDSGEYDKAIQTYRDILRDYPESVYNDYIQYQIALTWLESGNPGSAVIALRKLIAEFPQSKLVDDANYYLGVIYFQKGDYASARKQLEAFRTEFKESVFSHQAVFLLGEALLNLGEYKASIESFQSLLREAGVSESLRQKAEYEVAHAYGQMGNVREANRRLSDLITRYPDSPLTPNIIFGLGRYYAVQGDRASSRKYFERLIRNYPDNEFIGEAYIAIGETFLAEGKVSDALKSFSQARESGRLEAAARAALLTGDVYFNKKERVDARRHYEDAVALQTSWTQAAVIGLARILKEERQYGQAIALLEEAATKEGARSSADIYFFIAELFEESGDADQALGVYLKVHYLFEKDRDVSVKALLRVARIYENLGNRQECRKILEKIVSLDVPESKYAREKIQELGF